MNKESNSMKPLIYIIVIIALICGCKKDNYEFSKFRTGTFHGEKTVYYPGAHYKSVDTITIEFNDTTYTYSGSNAIDFGSGNYFVNNDSIEFNDLNARIALYTWDWILAGMYKFEITSDSLVLKNKYYNIQISCRLKEIKK